MKMRRSAKDVGHTMKMKLSQTRGLGLGAMERIAGDGTTIGVLALPKSLGRALSFCAKTVSKPGLISNTCTITNTHDYVLY